MKKLKMLKKLIPFALVLSIVLALGALTVSAESVFDFEIASVNGVIGGEDAVICTTQEAYDNCNPKWAISVVCDVLGPNLLQVREEAIAGQGTVPSVNVDEKTAVLVVHSSTSDTALADQYPNVFAKNAAMAVKVGQYLSLDGIDLEAGTGSGVASLTDEKPSDDPGDETSEEAPAESSEETPAESSEESVEESKAESVEASKAESAEESKAESAEASKAESAEASEKSDDEGGPDIKTIILIAAAVVVVIVVVVIIVVVSRKNKQK